MKILHISDLHLGKTLYGLTLTDTDQRYWVDRFTETIKKTKPDVLLIAGDVYDRSAPGDEAVRLLSEMVTGILSTDEHPVIMMISGNHDSGMKLSFAADILKTKGLHISGILQKKAYSVTLEDEYGPVTFWLIPYLYPALVNSVMGTDYRSYDEAMRGYLAAQDMDLSVRNVVVCHQNVVNSGVEQIRGGSESMVGGVGEIKADAFLGADYVALGHIHAAYPVSHFEAGTENSLTIPEIRYCGSPLCYHFTEASQTKKGPLLVELREKGTAPEVSVLSIPALHTMREAKGTLEELLEEARNTASTKEFIRLTVEGGSKPDLLDNIRTLYLEKESRVLETVYSVSSSRSTTAGALTREDIETKSEEALFADYWAQKKGEALPSDMLRLITEIAEMARNPKHSMVFTDKKNTIREDSMDHILSFIDGLEEAKDETH